MNLTTAPASNDQTSSTSPPPTSPLRPRAASPPPPPVPSPRTAASRPPLTPPTTTSSSSPPMTARTTPPITRHQYAGKHASGSGGGGARVRMRAGGCVLHRDQQVPGVLNPNMAPGGVKTGCSNCGATHTLRCCGAAAWITTWTPMPVGCIFLSFFLRCLLGSTYLSRSGLFCSSLHIILISYHKFSFILPMLHYHCLSFTSFNHSFLLYLSFLAMPAFPPLPRTPCSRLPLTLSLPHLVYCSLAPPTFPSSLFLYVFLHTSTLHFQSMYLGTNVLSCTPPLIN
jgi:hypothetical protein